jgi:carbon-monoxide dehydrogenase iron sulfur subunit
MREMRFLKDRCIQCGACKTACVAEHEKNHLLYDGLCGIPMAKKRAGTTATPHSLENPLPHPVRCLHCEEPSCAEACISGAIGVADRVYSNWERCVGCFMCVMNCPYGAIVPVLGKAVRCDHCLFTEKPACVRACPQNAILFVDTEDTHGTADKTKWKERKRRDVPLLRAHP